MEVRGDASPFEQGRGSEGEPAPGRGQLAHPDGTVTVFQGGRVTGRIGPGETGEVMIAIRGGTSAYHAHPADGGSVFTVGSRVLVIDYRSPQTVLVDELPEFLGSTPG